MAGSHVALGAAAWLAAAPHLGQPAAAPLSLALAIGGALLPDIDHPKSWVGRRLRPVSTVLARCFGHRGITHSLLAVFGCWWVLARGGLPVEFIAPVVVGYLSHLAADLLTPAGLRLTWPLKGTWSLPLCRAGSPFEPLVVAIVLCFAWSAADGVGKVQVGLRDLGVCDRGWDLGQFCPPPPRKPVRVAQVTPPRQPERLR